MKLNVKCEQYGHDITIDLHDDCTANEFVEAFSKMMWLMSYLPGQIRDALKETADSMDEEFRLLEHE